MATALHKLKEFVLTTLQGGFLVVFPVALALVVLAQVVLAMRAAISPLFSWFPEAIRYPGVFATLLLLLLSFVIGLFARGRRGDAVERKIDAYMGRLPLYGLWRSLTRQAFGNTGDEFAPAMVETDDGALALALVVEKNRNGTYTIFLPSVPTAATGQIFVMPAHRVHPVDESLSRAMRSLVRYGVGTGELMAKIHSEETSQSLRDGSDDK